MIVYFVLWYFVMTSSAKMITYQQLAGSPFNVTYDAQSFSINGYLFLMLFLVRT